MSDDQDTAMVISDQSTILRPVSLQNGMSLLPVEQQEKVLAEYDLRRNFFLKWLFSHLKEGISYGFPPGCEVKYDAEGNAIDRNGNRIRTEQWIAKPCLYDAGARLVIDLLHLKPTYKNDREAWEMAGSPKGTIFRICILIDQASGQIVGEGTGAFTIGSKGMDANSSIKMADKRALVAAVRNGVSVIGELFTQDIIDKSKERRKGNIKERQQELLNKITGLLIEKKSAWPNEPADWLRKAVASVLGANARLTSAGAIDEFERALDGGKINLDTAALV